MTIPFVPGYQAGLTLNLVDIGASGNVMTLNRSKGAPGKPVFGSQSRRTISGMITGSLTAGGHVDPGAGTVVGDLWTAFELETPVAFEIQIGESGGATDAGTLEGDLIMTSLGITTDAEGEWEWTIAADFDGAVTHTPAS